MKKIYKISLAVALLSLGLVGYNQLMASPSNVPTVSAAAADYFLKMEGIEGESSDPRHMWEIDVESWSWGESNPGVVRGGGGGGAGKASFHDFHFVMKASKASPKLMLAVATGKHFPEALLTVRKAGGDQLEYIKIKLTDVMVTSYQIGGTSDNLPTDQISLNFSKIEFEYIPQGPDGQPEAPVKAGYDLKLGKEM